MELSMPASLRDVGVVSLAVAIGHRLGSDGTAVIERQ
jgi:hypothetical protein